MLKVILKKIDKSPEMELTLYSSITRIPFSLIIGEYPYLDERIYARNLCGNNFIEFRFDKNTQKLHELHLVSVQENTVENYKFPNFIVNNNEFFSCFLSKEESILEDSKPMKTLRGKSFLCLCWEEFDLNNIEYFALTSNCLVGVNTNSYLVSILMSGLNEKEIINILGF